MAHHRLQQVIEESNDMKIENVTDIEVYLREYTRKDIISRYLNKTAGAGIDHALNHVYAPIYSRVVQELISANSPTHRFRVLEYGCGGGMNLLKLIEILQSEGAQLEMAFGTDFSPPMIDAARDEAAKHLPPELNQKINYLVAGNEKLMADLARGLDQSSEQLKNTFDCIVGVNTFRYAHRLQSENQCARDIFDLLRPGGYSVMIDMNRYFPFFRSKLRHMFSPRTNETYIPSLKEYTRPFKDVSFKIRESRNFCWIPHSAKPGLLALCRKLTPVLDVCCSSLAMRSLVIAQKPI
jgi:SAM-dependent methyltransferase